MGITELLGISNNININLPKTLEASEGQSLGWLSLIPPRYAFLIIAFLTLNDCVLGTDLPPTRPDSGVDAAGDADEPTCIPREEIPNDDIDQNCDGYDDQCLIGEARERYDGPPETQGVGACQPQIEECQLDGAWRHYVITQEQVLPSEEVCDGVDNDCRGSVAIFGVWSSTFGGERRDVLNSLQQTSDGDLVLAGTTSSFGAGSDDGWLIRTNAEGIEEWSRTFGENNPDRFFSVELVLDGGFIIVGETNSFEVRGRGKAGWLVRTNEEGIGIWRRLFGESNWNSNTFYSVSLTGDGGFVAAGSRIFDGIFHAGWLVATDSNGDNSWSLVFETEGSEHFSAVRQTVDGGYILAGDRVYGTAAWAVKIDQAGSELWDRNFLNGIFNAVEIAAGGGFVLAGSMNSDGWLVRLDEDGYSVWARTFGGEGIDSFSAVKETADGGFILAGMTTLVGASNSDGWVVRTDREGVQLWSQNFGGNENDLFNSVAVDARGGIYLVGSTQSDSAGDFDGWLVRLCVE